MRKVSVLQSVIGGSAAAIIMIPGSAGAVKSYQGDDYSYDYDDFSAIRTCDAEADGKKVHADYTVSRRDGVGSGQQLQITDNDGANGVCASAGVGQTYNAVQRHRTVEEIPGKPDKVGNWTDTGAPG